MNAKLFLLGTFALTLAACGRQPEPKAAEVAAPMKEASYKELGYREGILTVPGGDQPFTGIARESYKDGKPKAEYPCRNGKFHGTVKEWHPNGKPLAETQFQDGERVGLNREWTESGDLYIERVYDHDRIVSEKKPEKAK